MSGNDVFALIFILAVALSMLFDAFFVLGCDDIIAKKLVDFIESLHDTKKDI